MLLSCRPPASPSVPTATTGATSQVDATQEVYYEFQVENPVRVVRDEPLRYPPALRRAGVEAEFVLHFVVDTTGAVEPTSFRVVGRAEGAPPLDSAFVAAAREAVLASQYTPASIRGRRVRQIVQRPMIFRQ